MASIRGHEVPVPSKVPIRKDAISALISMPGFRWFLQFLNVFSNFPSTGTNTFCWNQSRIILYRSGSSSFSTTDPDLWKWYWYWSSGSGSATLILHHEFTFCITILSLALWSLNYWTTVVLRKWCVSATCLYNNQCCGAGAGAGEKARAPDPAPGCCCLA